MSLPGSPTCSTNNWPSSSAEGVAAFRETDQARTVIQAALRELPGTYREHHADLLASPPDVELFTPFFLARAFEAVFAIRAANGRDTGDAARLAAGRGGPAQRFRRLSAGPDPGKSAGPARSTITSDSGPFRFICAAWASLPGRIRIWCGRRSKRSSATDADLLRRGPVRPSPAGRIGDRSAAL